MKRFSFLAILALCVAVPAFAESAASSASPAPVSNTSDTLRPADWQELRAAHQKALQADPDLLAKAAELTQRMRLFQAKLNAAMVKNDPKIAPIIAKFEGPHPSPQISAPPSKNP